MIPASQGTLASDGDFLLLTLRGAPRQATRYDADPLRGSASVLSPDFAAGWPAYFGAEPPTAALSFGIEGEGAPVTVALRLDNPRWNGRRREWRFAARRVPEQGTAPVVLGDPTRFSSATLLIGDATPNPAQMFELAPAPARGYP